MNLEQLQKDLEQSKQDLLKSIIESDLSKIDKLQLIRKHSLLPIARYIQEPFGQYEKQLQKIVKEKTGRSHILTNCWFTIQDFDRYRVVYFDEIEGMIDETDIVVATNRTTEDVIKIDGEEFVDCIYNYAIENNIIGFTMDW